MKTYLNGYLSLYMSRCDYHLLLWYLALHWNDITNGSIILLGISNASNEAANFKFRNFIYCFLVSTMFVLYVWSFRYFKAKYGLQKQSMTLVDGLFQVKWLNKLLSKLWPFVADVSKLICIIISNCVCDVYWFLSRFIF